MTGRNATVVCTIAVIDAKPDLSPTNPREHRVAGGIRRLIEQPADPARTLPMTRRIGVSVGRRPRKSPRVTRLPVVPRSRAASARPGTG
jgi:hypothetical protein